MRRRKMRAAVQGCPPPVAGRSLRHDQSAFSGSVPGPALTRCQLRFRHPCLRLLPTPAPGGWTAPHGSIRGTAVTRRL
jgi:hypothetical protein